MPILILLILAHIVVISLSYKSHLRAFGSYLMIIAYVVALSTSNAMVHIMSGPTGDTRDLSAGFSIIAFVFLMIISLLVVAFEFFYNNRIAFGFNVKVRRVIIPTKHSFYVTNMYTTGPKEQLRNLVGVKRMKYYTITRDIVDHSKYYVRPVSETEKERLKHTKNYRVNVKHEVDRELLVEIVKEIHRYAADGFQICIDTNIFINDGPAKVIEELVKSKCPVYVNEFVIRELDGLKDSDDKRVNQGARRAFNMLNEYEPYFYLLPPPTTKEVRALHLDERSNDHNILASYAQLKEFGPVLVISGDGDVVFRTKKLEMESMKLH